MARHETTSEPRWSVPPGREGAPLFAPCRHSTNLQNQEVSASRSDLGARGTYFECRRERDPSYQPIDCGAATGLDDPR